ncbi:MAG: ribosome small subunit-dependent GTPase A [Oscillospiraceae bacterium]|nr:ribosome small subunit-dependent GTPase A [Oscillospiraceae bacterium]
MKVTDTNSDNTELNGIIVKGIGGFYYVKTACGVFECRARGILRKRGLTPMVGDNVIITAVKDSFSTVDEIKPRKSCLIRPPIANLERLMLVISSCEPEPNRLIIDRMIAYAENGSIEPVLVFTKQDLTTCGPLAEEYSSAGFKVFYADYTKPEGLVPIIEEMSTGISALAGNSGVGKSTFLNAVMPSLDLETAAISKKLGRGKHTTRQAELFTLPQGGMVADTPGFSSIDIEKLNTIYKEDLPYAFREFEEYMGQCKFVSCSHTVEKSCAVLAAVQAGKISKKRHDSYCTMYKEVKDLQQWEKK